MSRAFLKIFLSFWLMTLTMVVGSLAVVHWYELGANKHLLETREKLYGNSAAGKLLREMVSATINYSLTDIIHVVPQIPEWISDRLYLLTEDGTSLLNKPIPPQLQIAVTQLSQSNSLIFAEDSTGIAYLGRQISLADNQKLRLIVYPADNNFSLRWQLFKSKMSPLAVLVCVLISGSICFILTYLFTQDIYHIQQAARRIATGDMKVDLRSHFGKRRDEMSGLACDIEKMAASLSKAMAEQKRLIKDVSHELRSPLARLQFALGIAQQRSNGEINNELNRIKSAADYLNDVISGILSLPVSQGATWELNDAVDLNSLLTTLKSHCVCEAQGKGVSLNFSSNGKDALVMTHGNTLIGAIENIVRNAIHYTNQNSSVDISLKAQINQGFHIQVRDHGSGIEEEDLEDIFEPFYRTDQARARSSGGYGLGLTIAQRTILLHGGTIKASNHPDGGLLVSIFLPAA